MLNFSRLYCIFLLFMFSCQHDKLLESALQLAGNNRSELEYVIDYYKETGDRQKLDAAKFLIKNMPGHQHAVSNLDSFNYKAYEEMINNNISQEDALFLLKKKYTALFFHRPDVEVIKAQYLINNIEWAFKVWREAPWGKQISFDHFCNEILPYRVGSEPLEEWREHYYNSSFPPFQIVENQRKKD